MFCRGSIGFVKDVVIPLSYNLSLRRKPTNDMEGFVRLFSKVIIMPYILSTFLAHNKLIYLAFEVLLKFRIL